MYQIILASNSPRRKEILEQVGVNFRVIASTCAEESNNEDPIELVCELATRKARDVAGKVDGPAIIIGADTVVAHNGEVLGKPKDVLDAKSMLTKLQNSSHEVFTGVTVVLKEINENGNEIKYKEISFADVSKVIVLPMTSEEIDYYISSNEPMDKAGAYAIQGKFAVYVKEIIGDYYNIVGLPISKLYNKLLEEKLNIVK